MSKEKKSKKVESDALPIEEQQARQLLFINKDPGNLTRTAEEIHAVGSYVSRGSRKWKRSKSYLDLHTSTARILGGSDAEQSDSSGNVKTPAASPSKDALKLRWRLLDGRVTSSQKVGAKDFAKAASAAPFVSASASAYRPIVEDTLSSESSSSQGTPLPSMAPPFPSSDGDHLTTIHALLQIYFQRIRPAVFSISRSWIWIDDSAFVLASPALTYAICAFTSAFFVGFQHGMDKLCLPPENLAASQARNTASSNPLWPLPHWFLFKADTISLLRRRLSLPSDPSRPIPKAELHAILFLMRLHILLGDQDAAQIHMSAISNATENAVILPDLRLDLAMWRVNFVLALRHPSAIWTRPYIPAAVHTQQDPLVDIDMRAITDVAEREDLQRLLLDRTILWTSTNPTPMSVPYASEALIQDYMNIDTDGQDILQPSDKRQLQACLLIGRYLFAYLRYIDADTSLGCIRQLTPDLRNRLSSLFDSSEIGEAILWTRLPRVLTFLLFVGAFASRGFEDEKAWFIQQLSRGFDMRILRKYEDVTGILETFLGLETLREALLVDVWSDVMREVSEG